MEMWEAYKAELDGSECYRTEDGFVMFQEYETALYVNNVWVRPESRRKGVARSFLEYVVAQAKVRGKQFVTASVNLEHRTCSMSLRMQLNLGFLLSGTDPGKVHTVYVIPQEEK